MANQSVCYFSCVGYLCFESINDFPYSSSLPSAFLSSVFLEWRKRIGRSKLRIVGIVALVQEDPLYKISHISFSGCTVNLHRLYEMGFSFRMLSSRL